MYYYYNCHRFTEYITTNGLLVHSKKNKSSWLFYFKIYKITDLGILRNYIKIAYNNACIYLQHICPQIVNKENMYVQENKVIQIIIHD